MKIRIIGSHEECAEAIEAVGLVLNLGTVSPPRPATGEPLGVVEVYARAELREELTVVPPPANPTRIKSAKTITAAEIEVTDRIVVHGHGWSVVTRVWPEQVDDPAEMVWIWTAADRPLQQSVYRAGEPVRVSKVIRDNPGDGAQ
jgi:hypothetical protein